MDTEIPLQQKHSPTTLFIIAAFIVGSLGGYFFGLRQGDIKFQKKAEEARQALPIAEEINLIGGVITAVSGTSITVKLPSRINPFDDIPVQYEVLVTQDTKFTKTVKAKDLALLQKEVAAYERALEKFKFDPASGAMLPLMPSLFEETPIVFSDLRVGDAVIVYAGENIKGKTSFMAVRITVQTPQ